MKIIRIPFLEAHLDLESIRLIGDAEFYDRMGHGGWFVGFSMELKLHEKRYHREWEADVMGGVRFTPRTPEEAGHHEVQLVTGEWSRSPREYKSTEMVPTINLQRWIDEQLVKPWMEL